MGVSSYSEAALPDLPHVGNDLEELAEVFGNPLVGQFESVETLLDYSRQEGIAALSNNLKSAGPADLLLVYISGHMQVAPSEDLVICTRDSISFREDLTGLTGQELLAEVGSSQAGQIVLILDGCYSGSIHSLSRRIGDLASGNVVVISSAEDKGVAYAGAFSKALVEGLTEGLADIDGDGDIKVFEAFEYARKKLKLAETHQDPALSMFGRGAASVILAQSTRDEPRRPTSHGLTGLPDVVLADMVSTSISRRERATWVLGALYCSDDSDERTRAILALHEMAEDDDPIVSGLARLRLNGKKEMAERLKGPTRQDWTQAVLQIATLEINMAHGSGDLNFAAAGNDVVGNALGNNIQVQGSNNVVAGPGGVSAGTGGAAAAGASAAATGTNSTANVAQSLAERVKKSRWAQTFGIIAVLITVATTVLLAMGKTDVGLAGYVLAVVAVLVGVVPIMRTGG